MIAPNVMRLESPEQSYPIIIGEVMAQGEDVTVRGNETREAMGMYLIFDDPTDCMIVEGEKREFLESEIETIMEGKPPKQKAPDEVAQRLDLEEDGTFFEDGVRTAVSELFKPWYNRFNTVGRTTRKNASTFSSPGDHDPPCTMVMQFMLRGGELHLITFNRSQDLIFAFPMDAGLFGNLLNTMAKSLGVPVGKWCHLMGSAHIYRDQWDEAKEIIPDAEVPLSRNA